MDHEIKSYSAVKYEDLILVTLTFYSGNKKSFALRPSKLKVLKNETA